MSILANQTERKALQNIAKAVRVLEDLTFLRMTKDDDQDVCKAVNLLRGIIESNEYQFVQMFGRVKIQKVTKKWKS